ncbi:hypothetical protein [Neisseria sicca]
MAFWEDFKDAATSNFVIPACAGMTKLQPSCFDLPYFAGKAHATVARLKVCNVGFAHGLSSI